jgi:uncharacterized protein YlzI (FlbEa/FlbD family)
MGMLKLTKERTRGELIFYVNTDYIQTVRPHPNVTRGNVPTMVDMMDGATTYQVIESVEEVLEMIKGKDPFDT